MPKPASQRLASTLARGEQVRVDRELYIGSASCSTVSPNSFDLDLEGKAVIKKKDGTTTSDFAYSKDLNDTCENFVPPRTKLVFDI